MIFLIDFPFKKKTDEAKTNTNPEKELQLLKLIISRYRNEIEEKEKKSISEMKSLINPNDEKVIEIRDRIASEFKPYLPERDFEKASEKALSYIKTIQTIEPYINFWISFKDMDKIKAGDEMDKALFLASILKALAAEEVEILVSKDKKAFVIFRSGNIYKLVDLYDCSYTTHSSREDALSSQPPLYSFTPSRYEDYSE